MKIRAKGTPEWNNFDHCVVAVSMGSHNHTGAPLQAIIDFVNQANYQTCEIDLSDTLYRHDFMLEKEMSEEDAHQASLGLGDQWLKTNQVILDSIQIPCTIHRWDRWRNDPRFAETHMQFNAAFENQPAFRAAVMSDVHKFFARQQRQERGLSSLAHIRHSINYILEEITCHTLMYGDLPQTAATLYPGRELACYALVRAGLVDGVPNGLTKSYFVRLNLWNKDKAALSKETGYGLSAADSAPCASAC
jgi:tRNA-dependent cyclodipeptide synthase